MKCNCNVEAVTINNYNITRLTDAPGSQLTPMP